MRLQKYINEKTKYNIYVDMDGVIADFLDSASVLKGETIPTFKEWSKIKKNDWKLIAAGGHQFWSNLKWMSNGKKLWKFLSTYTNPNILSAYPTHPNNKDKAIKGKNIWVRKNLSNVGKVYLVKGIDKQKYATPNSVLIDDSERNINQWIAKGGIGILYDNNKYDEIIQTLNTLFYG